MKIAIISFFSGNIERGAENWVHEISLRFSKKYKVVIFQNEEKIDWSRKNSAGGLTRFFFLDYWSIAIGRFTFKILPILWKGNFDIIIPINGGWQTTIVRILTIINGSKMMIVGHSGKGWDDRFNILNFPDCFIALTNHTKDWAKKVNPFVRIEQIPNGVDLKKFTPKGKKLQINFKKPTVLCVSALVKTKRIDLVIKALAFLTNVNLLIVGKGDLENEIRELGEKLLGERFRILNLTFYRMPQVYRSANLFTLPSWENEAFPLVYLEAMASGLPVVATDDEIRKEIVGGAGILVDPNNLNAYADSIKQALGKNWADLPRKQAEKFSWEKISKRYEEVLGRLG